MSTADDQFDSDADESIRGCMDPTKPKSFFLYAGAGSGKTRSLVTAVSAACREHGRHLSLTRQKIGVITYTNAACDEIKQRLEFDQRVEVSTIHAFAWSMLSGYNADIRQWLAAKLMEDIAELELAQSRGRGGKAAADRIRSIESKRRRHARLGEIVRFIYSPTGDNRSRDSLGHSEVIAMASDFLTKKPALRRLLITRFPILLIDESQDTNRQMMDALLDVEAAHPNVFCLGLFGDMMQRIYTDGKERLADAIPPRWERPCKRMNHRCPTRVVELINTVRRDDDQVEQVARSDAGRGTVRLFILPGSTPDKPDAEAAVAERMAEITGDLRWAHGQDAIKTLALEHLMSARRLRFDAFFRPLYAIERARTSFLQGTGAGIGLFTHEIVPLMAAMNASDRFATAAILRRSSPLLDRKVLEAAGDKQTEALGRAKAACDALHALVCATKKPSARDVLMQVANTGLFAIPDALAPFAQPDEATTEPAASSQGQGKSEENDEADVDIELAMWRQALEAPFDQIERYDLYVRDLSQFDTHQGVKGREFPRVMVVVSDEEARGFMFAYDKLFGTREKSKIDLENEAAGKDTTVARTRRLFYVTCSRTEESLAIVYYTDDPKHARDALLQRGWFKLDEIEIGGEVS